MVTKVVINAMGGVFSLSAIAWELLALRKGGMLHPRDNILFPDYYITLPDGTTIKNETIKRDDADLVAIVEGLGTDAASTEFSQLEIVTIPDDVTRYFLFAYREREVIHEGYIGRTLNSRAVRQGGK